MKIIRHQFVRLFLSIILISFVILSIQCMMVFVGNKRAAEGWKEMVFQDFIDSIDSSISNIEDADDSDVMNMMISRTSERISGLLLRDSDGRFVLSLGTSPLGEQIPSPSAMRNVSSPDIAMSRFKLSYQNSINYTNIEVPAARYTISISTMPGTGLPVSADVEEAENEAPMLVSLPSIVADQDIAGTISIKVDGNTIGYIDVLVYRIDFYQPTLFATKQLLFAFIISVPIAFIVAAILAACVSKWNAKSVRDIQNSLSALSRGYFDVEIPKQSTEEMDEIASSIKTLGKELSRHQQSRKEWIRNISHDLNTPVTSLNILINGALDGVFPLDKNLIESMKRENDTLIERIQSVAYYSYLLSPDVKVEKNDVSVISVLRDTVMKHDLECVLPETDAMINADTDLLERAFSEVIFNADTYGSPDSEPYVTIDRKDSKTIISICNKGHLPDPLPQFFEPWARGDASRTAGGSGLGLPIVYQIMLLHSGSVVIGEQDGVVSVSLIFPS